MEENELAEWMAYDRISPIGEWHLDLLFSQLCSVIANCNRDRKKKPSPYKIEDFLLFGPSKKPQKQSVEQMKKLLMGLVEVTKKKVKKKEKVK